MDGASCSVSSLGIRRGANEQISSEASVEAQAAKHRCEESAKAKIISEARAFIRSPSTQPKPKNLRRLGKVPARNPSRRLGEESSSSKESAKVFIVLPNVKAHPPLGARANVERGVEVVIIIKAGKQWGS